MAIGTVNLMKQINLEIVRRVMKESKKATKPQLAKLTGLSVVTINSLVEILLKNGEILIDEEEISSGGRPATTYLFNKNHSLALIIYTSELELRDLMHIAVVNLYEEVIELNEVELKEVSEGTFGLEIKKMIERYPNIKSIGIGMPGQEIKGRMEISDYKSLEGKAFIEHLRNEFKLPVIFENDINAAVLGYCINNKYEDQNVVGIYIPEKYPLGAGICIKGDIYKGRDNFAGEVKFIPGEIDWKNPSHVSKNILAALKNLIITFTCTLNPDKLVIYRENLNKEDIDNIILECKKDINIELLPEIIVSSNFSRDFENGIKKIALKPLESNFKL